MYFDLVSLVVMGVFRYFYGYLCMSPFRNFFRGSLCLYVVV